MQASLLLQQGAEPVKHGCRCLRARSCIPLRNSSDPQHLLRGSLRPDSPESPVRYGSNPTSNGVNRRTLTSLLLDLAAGLLCLAHAAATDRPNFLFIIADDQSPFDLKVYDPASKLDTPNIDRLAREGLVLDGAYHMGSWSGAVCTPSRHMIMSGRTVWHLPNKRGQKKSRHAANKSWTPPISPGTPSPPSSTAPDTTPCVPASGATATKRPTNSSPCATTPLSAVAPPRPAVPGTGSGCSTISANGRRRRTRIPF